MNAKEYNKHHELQLRDGKKFIDLVVDQLQWSDMSGQVFMDIGCGPGTNCPKLLLERFPELQKIIGVDSEESMINLAKKTAAHPKIDYQVLNIETSNIPGIWQNNISKVVSVYCLHWVKDLKKALKNIYILLKASGEAALLFTLSCTLWDCLQGFVQNLKWKEMLQNLDAHIPESYFKQFDAFHYESLLKEVGFEIILCETKIDSFKFPTEKGLSGFIAGICPFINNIPPNRVKEFEEDLFQDFQKYTEDSKTFNYKCIKIIVKKSENVALK